MEEQVSFISLGGIGDVTKNMYVYDYKDRILLVDCGIGFADETMLGVDLLLPDITYLLNTKKTIAGMVLSHGHEDHIGALPFILPQLMSVHKPFPIFGTPLTAALANHKLKEYRIAQRVQEVKFNQPERSLNPFNVEFFHITHSIADTSHIFIQTPAGNFYHGSDYKFDLTPANGHKTDFAKIVKTQQKGTLCMMSDSLGAEKPGYTPSEEHIGKSLEREMQHCKGKVIVTTYSSNISRLNQTIAAAETFGRRVCFVGRSLLNTKDVAKQLKYLKIKPTTEIPLDQIKNYPDSQQLLIVAGSQGQENSAMNRIANGAHPDIKLTPHDKVIFSADPIPGNEIMVNELVDTIARTGAAVIYSGICKDLHVSGHGASQDILLLMSLVKAKKVLPISGNYKHMVAYKNLALKLGYAATDILMPEAGQEILFSKYKTRFGKKIHIRNVYLDQITGEEVESYVLRDRQKLSESGMVIVMVEIDAATGQLVNEPDVIIRGFSLDGDTVIKKKLNQDIRNILSAKQERVTNWVYLRKLIGQMAEKRIYRELRRQPLVLPVVIEI